MILDKFIDIKIHSCNIKYYTDLGYTNIKINQIISIPIKHLSPKNGHKVNVKCDICGFEKKINYYDYVKIINRNDKNEYSCNKCRLKNSFKKDGINISKLDYIKNKKKRNFFNQIWCR